MPRMKYVLEAPEGGHGEAVIEGTAYWPELDDKDRYVIETTNELHAKILKQHGFKQIAELAQQPPATSYGPIDYAELGRTGLADALKLRGVQVPDPDDRAAMDAAAQAWNDARRGRVRPTAKLVSAESQVFTDPLLEAEDMVDTLNYTDLKALLAKSEVNFNPQTPIAALRKVAHREINSRKALAA